MEKITKTSHGAVMSPRMSRLWTYIRVTRGISLSDFSTDQCVERVFGQLEAAYEAAPSEEIRRDLANIMRRRPANRVKATGSRYASGQPRRRKPKGM